MLNSSLEWLAKHRWVNFLILLVYFITAVLPHEHVGLWISDIFRPYTRDRYNLVLTICATGGLLVYLFIIYKNLSKPYPKLLLGYLGGNLILSVVCFKLLFAVNVEAIHFLQYAIFAILCFPLVNNYILTLIYATIAGSIDEAYQFYYLAPDRTAYYDFNDVIINLIGAMFGLILIRSLDRGSFKFVFKEFMRSVHFKIFLGLLVFIIGMFASGLLVKYYDPKDLNAKFWLIRESIGFWKEERHLNFKYHVVKPWEGVLIVATLLLAYSRLYKGVSLLNKV